MRKIPLFVIQATLGLCRSFFICHWPTSDLMPTSRNNPTAAKSDWSNTLSGACDLHNHIHLSLKSSNCAVVVHNFASNGCRHHLHPCTPLWPTPFISFLCLLWWHLPIPTRPLYRCCVDHLSAQLLSQWQYLQTWHQITTRVWINFYLSSGPLLVDCLLRPPFLPPEQQM